MSDHQLFELSAFAETAGGGNPAGVWIGDSTPDVDTMRSLAARLGHSETAFVTPAAGSTRHVRYFSPQSEVPFCGHATIATGVALGRVSGAGRYRLETPAGPVDVDVAQTGGQWRAAFVSVAPSHEAVPATFLQQTLAALGWSAQDLEPTLPPALAFAGANHLVLAVRNKARLDALAYDFDRLRGLLESKDLVTAQLVWRESEATFHSRNPFPTGGIVEDPATGAAAAALGGYLRDASLIRTPMTLTIRQGETMGKPSVIHVDIPEHGGIRIAGTAVDLH